MRRGLENEGFVLGALSDSVSRAVVVEVAVDVLPLLFWSCC